MLKLEIKRPALEQILGRVADYTLSMDLIWDWPCGVAYYGVSRAFEATGNARYLERMQAWCDEYMAVGLPPCTVNTCAMGHMLLTLYRHTAEQKYLEIALRKVEYLRNRAPRFGDGVLQHTVSVHNDFPEQCWADTLFMAAYFLLRTGVMLQDKHLVDDALHQYYWHIHYLQDEEKGLWYHGYDHIHKNHMSGFFWGRANAWAAYTMSRVHKVLPQPYLYPAFMDVDCSLRDQLAALKPLQREDGLWGTLLDDAESYGEVSATAGIAAAMVEAGNPLHAKYIGKALQGIFNNIADNGRVCNVSGGTAVMNDREGYRNIPKKWAQGWGQGLVLALLASLLEAGAADRQPLPEEHACL